jgi:ribose transport system ATP-binding protein
MDEPTSSLEPREVDRLLGVVSRLRTDGVTVVYISHRLEEVYRLCDRVTVMRDGRLVHTGPLTGISRLELVSRMLGRDVADVAQSRTRFDEHGTERAGEPVLRARGLSRRQVLHGVSVDVRAGEVVGLAGLLGSGRTETMNAVYGVDRLDSGSVEVAGSEIHSGSPGAALAAGIALIPEDRKAEGVVPNLSVRDNIVLSALPALSRAWLVSEKREDAVVRRLIARLDIRASSPDQPVGELSGGNQQKVLLARVLARNPRVLLLDDPTRGIDVGAKAEIQALISELAREGVGVVLASSELEEVVEGSDSIVVLRDGAVVGILEGEAVTEAGVMALVAEAAREAAEAVDGHGDD